jgi:hypothetical protein
MLLLENMPSQHFFLATLGFMHMPYRTSRIGSSQSKAMLLMASLALCDVSLGDAGRNMQPRQAFHQGMTLSSALSEVYKSEAWPRLPWASLIRCNPLAA